MTRRYWFRQKTFGYVATPATWEGWALTIAGLLLVAALVFLSPSIRDDGTRALLVTLGITIVIVPFSAAAWFKTEGGRRRRGSAD